MHINLLKLFFFYCFLYICVVHITDIHQFMLEVIRIMFSFFYFHVNHSLKTRKNRIFPPPHFCIFCPSWSVMVCYGPSWSVMVRHGPSWSVMVRHGPSCRITCYIYMIIQCSYSSYRKLRHHPFEIHK